MRRLAPLLLIAPLFISCGTGEKIPLVPVEDASRPFASVVNTADPNAAIQLLSGFHRVEENSWRWTMARFAVGLRTPEGGKRRGARLALDFTLPDGVLSKLGPVTLSAAVGGVPVGNKTYNTAGSAHFELTVPPSLLTADVIAVEFTLDKFLPAGTADERELGLVVSRIALAQV